LKRNTILFGAKIFAVFFLCVWKKQENDNEKVKRRKLIVKGVKYGLICKGTLSGECFEEKEKNYKRKSTE
jgi:hypothetical protein